MQKIAENDKLRNRSRVREAWVSGNLVENNSSIIATIDIDRVSGVEEERKGKER